MGNEEWGIGKGLMVGKSESSMHPTTMRTKFKIPSLLSIFRCPENARQKEKQTRENKKIPKIPKKYHIQHTQHIQNPIDTHPTLGTKKSKKKK